MLKTYSQLPTVGTNLLVFVTSTQQCCILLWNFISCTPDTKQQTGLLVQEKKKILKEIHEYLETFAINLIWSTALSTQPPWWPKKQKVQAKRHRNFSQDSDFQSVPFMCKSEKEQSSVKKNWLIWQKFQKHFMCACIEGISVLLVISESSFHIRCLWNLQNQLVRSKWN